MHHARWIGQDMIAQRGAVPVLAQTDWARTFWAAPHNRVYNGHVPHQETSMAAVLTAPTAKQPRERRESAATVKLTTVRFTITGTAPLLMHNERLANPFDEMTKNIAAITGKRTKTEEDKLEIARLEWQGGLYWDELLGPYIPGANVKRCFMNAATQGKLGKAFRGGLIPLDAEIPLVYPGPRDIEGLWAAGTFLDARSTRIGGKKVWRARPRFNEWGIVTTMFVNTLLVNLDALRLYTAQAGVTEGLGDYRPTFGRFLCDVEEL